MLDTSASRGPIPVLAFAHRGGMAHRRENTIDAFTHALALGARGIETDAWLTGDGVVVLNHAGSVRTRGRRTPISQLRRADLPSHVPSLADLYGACGADLDIAIDVLDSAAAAVACTTAASAGPDATRHLWLCGTDVEELTSWRHLSADIHLVHSDEDWRRHRGDVRSHARELRGHAIDVLNLPHRHCSAAVADACHREGVLLFAWGAQRSSTMREMVRRRVDGIMSDHVDRLMTVLRAAS